MRSKGTARNPLEKEVELEGQLILVLTGVLRYEAVNAVEKTDLYKLCQERFHAKC
jgi:hypothetical protein